MIVTTGLNYFNDVRIGITAAVPLYIALFEANRDPVLTDTAATFPGNALEITTEVDEATRVLFVPGASVAGISSNSANPAVFTFNNTITVVGGALFTASAKGATTGKLIQATRFTAPITYYDGAVLNLIWYLPTENI